ncbi:hypothetical protein D9M68_665360 [compost metagenome]
MFHALQQDLEGGDLGTVQQPLGGLFGARQTILAECLEDIGHSVAGAAEQLDPVDQPLRETNGRIRLTRKPGDRVAQSRQ